LPDYLPGSADSDPKRCAASAGRTKQVRRIPLEDRSRARHAGDFNLETAVSCRPPGCEPRGDWHRTAAHRNSRSVRQVSHSLAPRGACTGVVARFTRKVQARPAEILMMKASRRKHGAVDCRCLILCKIAPDWLPSARSGIRLSVALCNGRRHAGGDVQKSHLWHFSTRDAKISDFRLAPLSSAQAINNGGAFEPGEDTLVFEAPPGRATRQARCYE
jgi:hypothetical protein